MTGVTIGQPEVTTAKRLQLLKEALPALARVAVVWDVKRPADGAAGVATLTAAARDLGVRLRDFDIKSVTDFSHVFAAVKRDGEEAILLVESPRAVANRAAIAELGLRHRVPIITQFSRIVDAGGLMAYGPDLSDLFRHAATYVDKIPKGTPPAELPVQQPLKYELVINLKTAKALGLTIPRSVLARADRVVE